MEFSELRGEILKRLGERKSAFFCPICQKRSWTLTDGFVSFPVTASSDLIGHAGLAVLPCAALVCDHCGNTQFINLLTLGLGQYLESKWALSPVPTLLGTGPAGVK